MSMRLRNRSTSLSGRHPFLNTHGKRHGYKAGRTTQLTAYNFKALPDSVERVFLQAVQYGDLHTVARCLAGDKGKTLNVNCTDLLGRSGLMIAVDNENAELVELLLKQEGIKIGDALLYAIQEGSYQIVEMIINHPSVNKKMLGSGWGERMAQMELESPEFSRDVSPVILAAICNQFEILQLLLNHDAWIEKPHQLLCTCEKCALVVNKDSLRYSTLRINTYRALASPAWISLTNSDPILAAFKMSWELKNLAMREAEFKEIYMELSEQCKQYACDLLDQCRSTEEVIAILNRAYVSCEEDASCVTYGDADSHSEWQHRMTLNLPILNSAATEDVITAPAVPKVASKSENSMRRHSLAFVEDVINDVMSGAITHQDFSKMTLPRLRMAVKYEQRQFVINPVCQQLLNTLWYSQIPGWRKQSFLVKVLVVLGLIVSLPFFALVYLVAPQTKIGKLVRSPFVKFLYHATAIALFLTLLCINFFTDHTARETQRGPRPDLTECLILWFVLGFVWSEMKQVWEEGFRTYIRQWWNYVDIAMLSLFLCTASLRVVASIQVETGQYNLSAHMPRGDWPQDDPTFVAEAMFASACIFSFSRILFLFGLSQYLGPLQISLGRMLIDVGKFCLLFFLILTAFACGLHQLYCYNVVSDGEQTLHHPAFGTLVDSYRTLLWALFGHFHRYEIKINASDNSPNNPFSKLNFTERIGEFLMVCYLVVAMIILVNTLIAMITNSYDKIERQSDAEWKFARTKLWLDYFNEGSTLPPPLNILISPKSVVRFARGTARVVKHILQACSSCCNRCSANGESEQSDTPTPVECTPRLGRLEPVDTVVELDDSKRSRLYPHRGSLPVMVACGLSGGATDSDIKSTPRYSNMRSQSMHKRGSEASIGQRSVRERRLSLLSAAFSHNVVASSFSTIDRKYHEIMRKIVSRYILQRKKQYRDETVNEDDLLEIRQDISSLRYELREDRKHDQETRRLDIDRLKRDIVTQLNEGRNWPAAGDSTGPSLTLRTESGHSEMQSLRNELQEIRDELMGSIHELRKLVTEQSETLPHRSSLDQTYASDSLLERAELTNSCCKSANTSCVKDNRKLKRQPRLGFLKY